jgi:hypothetical protein
VRNTRHDLGEDGLTGVHQASDHQRRPPGSNREQALKASTPCKNAAYITPLGTKWDSIAPTPAPCSPDSAPSWPPRLGGASCGARR